MQEYPKMLYKVPGQHEANGGVKYDYVIADSADQESELKGAGWVDDIESAASAAEAAKTADRTTNETLAPTRAELEAQA